MRKTKIICTMGPSTDKEGILEQLAIEGMDVARFNFSHGPHEEQKGRLERLKAIRTKINRPIAALLDTKGPEIRIQEFEKGKVTVTEGQKFILTAEDIQGTEEKVSVTYKDLYKDVKPGDSILIDDGLIGLKVEKIQGTEIHCVVINGGVISNKKGVNLPGVNVNMPFISKKTERISFLESKRALTLLQLLLPEQQRMCWRSVRFWMKTVAVTLILLPRLKISRALIISTALWKWQTES